MDPAEMVTAAENPGNPLLQQWQKLILLTDRLLAAFHFPAQIGLGVQPVPIFIRVEVV